MLAIRRARLVEESLLLRQCWQRDERAGKAESKDESI
jgi:hypothetical protein